MMIRSSAALLSKALMLSTIACAFVNVAAAGEHTHFLGATDTHVIPNSYSAISGEVPSELHHIASIPDQENNNLNLFTKLPFDALNLVLTYLSPDDIAHLRSVNKELLKLSDASIASMSKMLIDNFLKPSQKALSFLGYKPSMEHLPGRKVSLLDQQIFILDKASMISKHSSMKLVNLDQRCTDLLPEDKNDRMYVVLQYLLPSASFKQLFAAARSINHIIAERIYVRILRSNSLTIQQLRKIANEANHLGVGNIYQITNQRIIHHPDSNSRDIEQASVNLTDLGQKELALEGYRRLLSCDDLPSETIWRTASTLGYMGATQLALEFFKKNLTSGKLGYRDQDGNINYLLYLGEEKQAINILSHLLKETLSSEDKRIRRLTTISRWLRDIGMRDLAIEGFYKVISEEGFQPYDVRYATSNLLRLGCKDKALEGLNKLKESKGYEISEKDIKVADEEEQKKKALHAHKLQSNGSTGDDFWSASVYFMRYPGDRTTALHGFSRALEVEFIDTSMLFETCSSLVRMGYSDLAIKGLSRLLDMTDVDLNYTMHIGWLSSFIGRIDLSVKAYLKALRHPEAHNQPEKIREIASNLIRLDYIKEGIDAYKLALVNSSITNDDIMNISHNLLLLGQRDIAASEYLKILDKKGRIDDSLVTEAYDNLVKIGSINPSSPY